MKRLVCIFFLCNSIFLSAQSPGIYLAELVDKDLNLEVETFLSERSLERRAKQGIPIVEADYPVKEAFIQATRDLGVEIIGRSKWLNALIVDVKDAQQWMLLNEQDYIKSLRFVTKGPKRIGKMKQTKQLEVPQLSKNAIYGDAENQIGELGALQLHSNGYTGEGMLIGILDSGFEKVNLMGCFKHIIDSNRLIDVYNFVAQDDDIFTLAHNHGTRVMSTMAGSVQIEEPYFFGTAPNASYCLYLTEDVSSETPVEELFLLQGLERADSVGVDVINISLGYFDFDNPEDDYTAEDLDGNTTISSMACNEAASKGILVVTSAGNDEFISTPGDADDVLTVGAITPSQNIASFSAQGPNADGQVKPDVVARGGPANVVNTDNSASTANGTSFSSPIIAGVATCLWQEYPEATNDQIISAIQQSAHFYLSPDTLFGYGIPNFQAARALLQVQFPPSGIDAHVSQTEFTVYPNSVKDELYVSFYAEENNEIEYCLIDLSGKQHFRRKMEFGPGPQIQNISSSIKSIQPGLYILLCEIEGQTKSYKIVKE